MDRVTYILDTTVVADRIRRHPQVLNRLSRASDDGHVLGLCDPERYEVLRGLLKGNATRKLARCCLNESTHMPCDLDKSQGSYTKTKGCPTI